MTSDNSPPSSATWSSSVYWLPGCIALLFACWFCLYYFRTSPVQSTYSQWPDESKGDNTLGPSPKSLDQFTYPSVSPILPFDLATSIPTPYRPFKWGPNYSITMGLRSGSWDEWIELDNRFPRYHAIKEFRVRTRGERVVQTLGSQGVAPSGAAAARELMFELAEYLSRRYPSVYAISRKTPTTGDYGWYGEGQIQTITIKPINVTYDLEQEDPMRVSGLLVQDDLAVMLEGSDGKYYLQAASICLAGSWRLEDKIGRPLAEIHTSAGVAQYREKLEQSMDRYFCKLKPDKLVFRHNYFFQVVRDNSPEENPAKLADPDELSWSYSGLGNEDLLSHEPQPLDQSGGSKPDHVDEQPAPSQIFFRTERQSLRRLPRSGAVVFTIHTYMESIEKLAQESGVPGRMASAVRSWPGEVSWYKARRTYGDVLLKYLDEMHEKQLELGLDSASSPSKFPY